MQETVNDGGIEEGFNSEAQNLRFFAQKCRKIRVFEFYLRSQIEGRPSASTPAAFSFIRVALVTAIMSKGSSEVDSEASPSTEFEQTKFNSKRQNFSIAIAKKQASRPEHQAHH